jgi:hypothetical protein
MELVRWMCTIFCRQRMSYNWALIIQIWNLDMYVLWKFLYFDAEWFTNIYLQHFYLDNSDLDQYVHYFTKAAEQIFHTVIIDEQKQSWFHPLVTCKSYYKTHYITYINTVATLWVWRKYLQKSENTFIELKSSNVRT